MRRWRSRGALLMRTRIIPTLEHILDVIARLAVDQRLTVYDAAYIGGLSVILVGTCIRRISVQCGENTYTFSQSSSRGSAA